MTPLAGARRLVVKIGSSILVDETKGEVRRDWLEALTNDVARLHKGGCEVVLVSSGAIRLGRTHLKLAAGPLRLEESQAAAATGQAGSISNPACITSKLAVAQDVTARRTS